MFLLFAIGLPVVLLFIGILAFAIYLLNYSQKNATNLTEEQIEKR
jgi:Na+-transporting methylmalonyl-CoA/oxaloacetate decarboxylase gamma subunit